MTEVLLINTNRETAPLPVYPIGLCTVASALARAGIPCKVVDLAFSRRPLDDLRRALDRERPRLVGVAIRNVDNCDPVTPMYFLPFVAEVIAAIRAATSAPVVIGGTGVSLDPERVLDVVGADLAVAGPGERAFVDIVQRLTEGGERIDDLPRVVHGDPEENPPAPQFARWLDIRPYRARAVPVSAQSRRGCPFRCVYCEYAHLEGRSPYQLLDAEGVVDRIARDVRATGSQVVEFVDSTFNSPPDYMIALCERLASRGVAQAYHASGITPRYGGREVLEALKAAGFSAIYCSPDAAHPDTIEGYCKGFSMDQLSAMARDASELDLPVLWSFIMGGPGETTETAREVLRFAREEIDPEHVVMLTPRMRIYPGTALQGIAREEGLPPVELDPREPGQFYLSPTISEAEIDEIVAEALSTIGNAMAITEGRSTAAAVIQRLLGLRRSTTTNWKGYPRWRQIQRRFGVRWH